MDTRECEKLIADMGERTDGQMTQNARHAWRLLQRLTRQQMQKQAWLFENVAQALGVHKGDVFTAVNSEFPQKRRLRILERCARLVVS